MKPRAIILSGYGLNCEDETAFAFRAAGAEANIVHINELSGGTAQLKKYQILAVPGGFSFGDDTGSGKAYAHKLEHLLGDEIQNFIERDTLTIGICNGFQILTNMRIIPGALAHNDSNRYISKWVEIDAFGASPWLRGIKRIPLPIAHGEGKYIPAGKFDIAFRYVENPNGSTDDIAGILGYDGRVLGIMPHPERAQFSWQRPPGSSDEGGQGLQIFKNAVRYFE